MRSSCLSTTPLTASCISERTPSGSAAVANVAHPDAKHLLLTGVLGLTETPLQRVVKLLAENTERESHSVLLRQLEHHIGDVVA